MHRGFSPAKIWKSPRFSGSKLSAMVPVMQIPFSCKERSLDILLYLLKRNPDIAKSCVKEYMSEWISDLETATWELVWDSAIIRIRTKNLFYNLAFSCGTLRNYDEGFQSSRDVLSSYVVF